MTQTAPSLTTSDLIAALGLPGDSLVQQRVPKKMLAENGASTAADRKLIQECIEEVSWVAALKPSNAGVPVYEDAIRSYLELAVLVVQLRGLNTESGSSKVRRLAELVHRAIPYPVVLVLDDGKALVLSLAHIRGAQNEAGKTVLDGDLTLAKLQPLSSGDSSAGNALLGEFLSGLALKKQPRTHFFALYQGWIDTLTAWDATSLSGRFEPSASPEQAAQRREALRRCRELESQIGLLRNKAAKEKQMARQVAINLEVKALLAEHQQTVKSI